MLRSGALERRWVGSLHRLGSSLDLKDTVSWKQKAWRGHTWTPAPREVRGAGGQITGALTGPWTPLRKPPGGRCSTAPAEASRGRCTSAAPPGLSPPRRGKSTQSRGRNRWKRRLGSERREPAAPAPGWATDSTSPGDPPAGSTHAGLGGGRGNRQGRRAISTSSRKGWSPENRPYFNPGQEARRALSPCLPQSTLALWISFQEPESPLARLGLPKAHSNSHLP